MLLRVATLNVWGMPPPIGKHVRWRMRRIGKHLALLDLDVVAFQEVWLGPARERLIRRARRAGLEHIWYNPDEPGAGGLLVASRLPIEAPRFAQFTLPWAPTRVDQLSYYAGRGFVDLRLQTPAGPVRLVDTHLDSQSRRYRVAQAVELAARLADIHEPLLALGDFNFRPSHPEYGIWRGLTGMRDAAREIGNPEPTVLPGNPLKARTRARRIDYVFLRDGERSALRCTDARRVFDEPIERRAGEPAAYSDHSGVLAEIELEDRPPPRVWKPDSGAAALARRYLAEGRARAESRHAEDRALAGAAWAGVLLSAVGVRNRRVSRRRLLRRLIQAAGIAAVPPAVAFAVFSGVYAPDELQAYDSLAARLDHVLDLA